MIQTIEASNARRVISASASPTCRARFWRSGGNRPATIAINTRLSMPSTISRAVSVTRLAQICGSVSQSIPALSRSLAAHKIRRNNLQLAQCQRLHPSARRWHRVAAGNPRADLGCVKQQDAAHLLDRVRVRLYRVSGADDVFGIHTVEMRARIFDDTVVAREVGTDLEDAHWEGKKSPQELGDRIFGEIAATVRCGNEDDTTHIGQWLDKDGLAQDIAPFRREVDL